MTIKNRQKKKKAQKKSSPAKKSGRKSTSTSPISIRKYESEGFQIALKQQELSKRSATCTVAADEIHKIPKEAIITQKELSPAVFEIEEPPRVALADEEAENKKAWIAYRNEKERWEAAHADDKPMLEVTLWVPVKVILEVRMNSQLVKIFHTLRGPVMGLVKSEDMHRAFLYSPCFIDPNIERGRIHYLPIAFAGFEFTLYKGGMGESTPQEAEIEGYPHFVSQNRAGDYTFRMKAAYHHIEADYPGDAKLISADGEPRDALMGLITTSDTREVKLIERGRQAQAIQEQQFAAAQAEAIPSPSEDVTSPVEEPETGETTVATE